MKIYRCTIAVKLAFGRPIVTQEICLLPPPGYRTIFFLPSIESPNGLSSKVESRFRNACLYWILSNFVCSLAEKWLKLQEESISIMISSSFCVYVSVCIRIKFCVKLQLVYYNRDTITRKLDFSDFSHLWSYRIPDLIRCSI